MEPNSNAFNKNEKQAFNFVWIISLCACNSRNDYRLLRMTKHFSNSSPGLISESETMRKKHFQLKFGRHSWALKSRVKSKAYKESDPSTGRTDSAILCRLSFQRHNEHKKIQAFLHSHCDSTTTKVEMLWGRMVEATKEEVSKWHQALDKWARASKNGI